MTIETELTTVALRALIYVATIGAVGAALFQLTFPDATHHTRGCLRWQMRIAVVLLAITELLRYSLFQITISGGDPALGFSSEMRWLYLQSPAGTAALQRLAGAVLLLAAGLRFRFVALLAALVVVGSFVIEGHAAAHKSSNILAPAVMLHLLVVHWWFGALVPLAALSRHGEPAVVHDIVSRFGRIAVLLVPLLAIAGMLALCVLVEWNLDPDSVYQQRFALKLVAIACVLLIAAVNKLWMTPALLIAPVLGRRYLHRSLRWETAFAVAVIVATAWATATAPGMDH